jgi:thioredoxin-like negative regulator of GroEL
VLHEHYRSEDVPEPSNDPIKKIVGKTFAKDVLQSDRHVLVGFAVTWDGPSIKLKPLLEKLKERVKHIPNLDICIMDMVKNQVPNLWIEEYPSVFLWVKGKKKNPIFYTGDGDMEDMVEYVASNIGEDWEEPDL